MNTSEPKEPSFITILGRAFTIMEELLKSDKPLGVSELARLTGIPKANTFRIMKTLEELKAVSPKEDGYILGSKMIELALEPNIMMNLCWLPNLTSKNYQRLVRKQSILESCFRIMYFLSTRNLQSSAP